MSNIYDFLREKGFDGVEPTLDDQFHEFKTRARKGWLIGSEIRKQSGEPIQILTIEDWRTGERYTYKSNGPYTEADQELARVKILELRKKYEDEKRKRHEDAKEKASKEFETFSKEGESSYLSKKQIAVSNALFHERDLIIGCRDIDGEVWGYQRITPSGEKFFLKGQKTKGTFHVIGDIDASNTLYLCEGFATGASAHMATGTPVAVAFFANNLLEVGAALREKYKSKRIIIAADDDKYGSAGNAGRTKAEITGQAISAKVIFPKFKDESTKPTDFNDLHVLEGIEEVRNQLSSTRSDEIEFVDKKPAEKKLDQLPEPTGLLKSIRDEILSHSPRPNKIFAMSGAISLMSAFCMGRFELNGVWPMIFSLVIGKKSSGKNAPREFCSKVLSHSMIARYNLMGQIHHNSKQSLIMSLPKQRTRLDLVDEYSGFLRNYQRENSYAHDAALELTQIWSLNGNWYGGIKSISRGTDTGECHGPGISVMALIQPEPFVEIVSRDMVDTGYLARFLFFYSNEIKPKNEDSDFLIKPRNVDNIALELRNAFTKKSILTHSDDEDIIDQDNIGLIAPRPETLRLTKISHSDLKSIWNDYEKKQFSAGPVLEMLYSKAFEQLTKLLIIKVVSDGRREVSTLDVDWAYSMMETLISNCANLVGEASAGTTYEKFLESARNFIMQNRVVTKAQFTRKFQRVTRRDRENIINDLKDCNEIRAVDSGKISCYQWIGQT